MAAVNVTKDMAADALLGIDWTAVDTITDEEIARQVAGNSDAAPILSDIELGWATFGEYARKI